MTRKLWVAVCLTLFLGIFSLSVQQTTANTSALDQESSSGAGSLLISTGSRMYQTFKPTLNRLDKVAIEITDATGNLSCAVKYNGSGSWVDIATVINQPAENGWNVFDFEDVIVSPETTYTISITGDYGPKWKYSTFNPYSRGYAVWQSTDRPTWDFNFETFGTQVTMPAEGEEDDTVATPTTTSTTTTGNAPATMSATTSTALGKPGNLKAEYINNANQRGVNLQWKQSSTADIYGYIIFRSEKSTSGYTKVGEVIKETLSFLDTTVVASKTYYYQVRAYKASEQSASSNTASVATPTDIGPARPVNFKITESGKDYISLSWDKNTEANLSGYTITLYEGDNQISTAEIVKDVTTYKFSNLTEGINYQAKLVAKDSNGKFSTPAWAFGSTTFPAAAKYVINKWTGLLAGIGFALLAILITMIIIERKNHSKAK